MGWTVIREHFDGDKLEKPDEEFIPETIESFHDPRFQLLRYIDPYEDTTFNCLICVDLLKDLAELKLVRSRDEAIIDRIIELAKKCCDEPHTFLKFYGD